MLNDDIVGGLKSALERGATLKQAMMSLFNSGYKREEIEEAARSLNVPAFPSVHPIPASTLPSTTVSTTKIEAKKEIIQPLPKKTFFGKDKLKEQAYPQLQVAPQTQKVSSYGKPVNDNAIITFLVILLILLLSTLAGILIFKDQLINFFNDMLA